MGANLPKMKRTRGRPSKIDQVRDNWQSQTPEWGRSLDSILDRMNESPPFTLEGALDVIEQQSGVRIGINTLRRWAEAANEK